MKKIILGLAITASSLAFGQATTKEIVKSSSPITLGAKGGINFSTTDHAGDGKVGFYAGGFVNIPLSKHFSLQPELIYTMRGEKYTIQYSPNVIAKSTNTDHLLSVPVMFQYDFNKKFYLEAGTQFDFLVSGKTKETGTINGSPYEKTYKSEKGLDVNLGIGAGYYITPKFGVSARFVTRNGAQLGILYKFK
ncbi:porin family protein [Chryseobacterium limigenitum]|uniref:Outer membrane protein beta-barrel domain-containing protein n=1 Tax=Chryseobacterium limigenitum TaxID=1612149 RepID=A0A1K2ICT1_9FLAO|nr:porin family protein [Chryseobacterium limigenitum]SFZ90201.1 Outer membrane protein beta-barrel domain-containing protein [Chryseobacterium limigenitum]